LPTGASRPTRRIANANDKTQRILQDCFATATQLLQLVAQEVAQKQLVAQEAPQEVVTQAIRKFK
jgi:3-methyladenine DNA glycosylase AlkD